LRRDAAGLDIGVYTSDSQWVPIMGSYTGGSSYPLWYAHYDGEPNFDDFSPFNGWSSPYMKANPPWFPPISCFWRVLTLFGLVVQQFSESGAKCSVSYDINWHPVS
jgi:hypothetical protein